jgi:hypothetical protein
MICVRTELRQDEGGGRAKQLTLDWTAQAEVS